MNVRWIAMRLAALALAMPGSLLGQPALDGGAGAKGLCFEGRPGASCSSFLLTQARVQYRLSPATADPTRWYLTADLGWMKNISQHDALGVSVFGGPEFGFEEVQYGLRARYRRWLGERSGVDVSAGAVFGTTANIGEPGFSGAIDLNYSDLFLASFVLEYANTSVCALEEGWLNRVCGTSYKTRTYLGIGLGSKLGLVSYGIAGLVGLLALVFAGSGF
ncbi:MAG TPA: hypothetical protein VLC48_02790 [Gemmatimonadota bacterium]|nr:hypothetical protein [Gemmatimonadota bacterium]